MKYILLLLVFTSALMSAELKWLDDYNSALREAKKEHKLIYIFISSSTCGWCHKFEKTTLQDDAIKKRLAKEFVTVHLIRDFDDVPKKFKTSPVPRHYFTDAQGNILYNSLGYRKEDTFNAFMDFAEDQYKSNTNKEKK
jgi:thioredoxin-related protein